MPIAGFNLEKTSAERKSPLTKGMKATHNITIASIEKEDIAMGKNSKQPGLKFTFEYTVDYQPKIGNINITGNILYMEEEKEINSILASWKKDKKISPELTAQLLNTAIVRCSIKALSMAQEVALPPHLPMPTVSAGKQEKAEDYIG